MRLLTALCETGEVLGAQACLVCNGKTVVDAAAGVMGSIDPRPVSVDSLFQLYGAGSPLLATLALKEVARGALRLDAPVAMAWEAFGQAGKSELSVAEVLNHRTGLANAMPAGAGLGELSDVQRMLTVLERAAPEEEERAGGACHEGLPWGWALAGVLQESSGMGLEALLDRRVLSLLGVDKELMLRAGGEEELRRCVKVSAAPLLKEAGLDIGELIAGGGGEAEAAGGEGSEGGEAAAASSPAAENAEGGAEGGGEGSSGAGGGGGGIEWERFEGPKQLMNPATLNMRSMRQALLPGISAHGSAHGLAQFYAALGAGKLVPPALLAQAQQLSVPGTGAAGEAVRFGLGFQLGTCADAGPLQRVNVESRLVNDAVATLNNAVTAVRGRGMGLARELGAGGGDALKVVIGHSGVGGSIGLCVPEQRVALAVTVSRLSGQRVATKKLLELMLSEVGLAPPHGL